MPKKVTIIVDSSVRVRMDSLPSDVVDAIKNEFTFDNPDYHMKRLLNIPGWWREKKDVGIWGEVKNTLVIPRGGLRSVRDVLEEHSVSYKLVDKRTTGHVLDHFPAYIGFPMRYYQNEAIEAALKKQNCIIRMPTGSGKSIMAIALAVRAHVNTLVILPTVGLFKQWCEDARASLKMDPDELGIIHQKKRKLRPFTIAVQGTLASQGIDEELQDFFGMIIEDEVQRAPAKSFMQAISPFPAKYRIGISADERRKDKKEFITRGLFGSVAYEKKRKELEDEGFIADVEIRVVPTNFRADWYGLSQDATDDREVDFDRLLKEMMLDEERNELARKFVIDELERGEQAIMLSHRVAHCTAFDQEFVRRGFRTGLFVGEFQAEFEKTRAGILDGSVQVGVGTYQALGVGVNLPAVAVGMAVTPIGGNRFNFNQVRGRLNRKGGKKADGSKARMYVLLDRFVYPRHLENIVSWNPTVTIFENGRFVDARHYLKRTGKKGR